MIWTAVGIDFGLSSQFFIFGVLPASRLRRGWYNIVIKE